MVLRSWANRGRRPPAVRAEKRGTERGKAERDHDIDANDHNAGKSHCGASLAERAQARLKQSGPTEFISFKPEQPKD